MAISDPRDFKLSIKYIFFKFAIEECIEAAGYYDEQGQGGYYGQDPGQGAGQNTVEGADVVAAAGGFNDYPEDQFIEPSRPSAQPQLR